MLIPPLATSSSSKLRGAYGDEKGTWRPRLPYQGSSYENVLLPTAIPRSARDGPTDVFMFRCSFLAMEVGLAERSSQPTGLEEAS